MKYLRHLQQLYIHALQPLQGIRINNRQYNQKRQIDRQRLVSYPDQQHNDKGNHRHSLEHNHDRLQKIPDQFVPVTDEGQDKAPDKRQDKPDGNPQKGCPAGDPEITLSHLLCQRHQNMCRSHQNDPVVDHPVCDLPQNQPEQDNQRHPDGFFSGPLLLTLHLLHHLFHKLFLLLSASMIPRMPFPWQS